MATYQIAAQHAPQFIGLSSDLKPNASDNLLRGSRFYETDTRRELVWDGTDWVAKETNPGDTALANDLLASMLAVQHQILEELQLQRLLTISE